jgi:hypothetical protein
MLFHPLINQKKGGKEMRKKLALLGFLMLVSVGIAYTVAASDALKGLALGVFGRNEIRIDERLIPQFTKLSEEQRAKAVEIALGDPQVQGILEGADNYYTSVSDVFEVAKDAHVRIIPKEGLALVELRIYKDYDEEVGLKVVNVIVDLTEEKVKEINEFPEARVPKAQGEVQSGETAIQIGKQFLDGIGYVTGDVLFVKLDEENPNFYWHELAKLEKPDVQGLRTCWIVRFEQAYRPGHWFEVWIDAQTGEVIGGQQCR